MSEFTSDVMMIRPAAFGFNSETAADNVFQQNDDQLASVAVQEKAVSEFNQLVLLLRSNGVNVHVFEDTPEPPKPDAVFPNNWISFHNSGQVVTWPMYSAKRRPERRDEIIGKLTEEFRLKSHIRFEQFEEKDQFLEGTGSMVLDRVNRLAFACRSDRTNGELLEKFCAEFNYRAVQFDAIVDDKPVYHTNVLMALGHQFAVICLSSICKKPERVILKNKIRATGREIIDISIEQLRSFAGNMLQLINKKGDCILVMSSSAFNALSVSQKATLEKYTKLLHTDLQTIEKYGGGSARCIIAEIFLPTIAHT